MQLMHGPSYRLQYLDLRANLITKPGEIQNLQGCVRLHTLLIDDGGKGNSVVEQCEPVGFRPLVFHYVAALKSLDGLDKHSRMVNSHPVTVLPYDIRASVDKSVSITSSISEEDVGHLAAFRPTSSKSGKMRMPPPPVVEEAEAEDGDDANVLRRDGGGAGGSKLKSKVTPKVHDYEKSFNSTFPRLNAMLHSRRRRDHDDSREEGGSLEGTTTGSTRAQPSTQSHSLHSEQEALKLENQRLREECGKLAGKLVAWEQKVQPGSPPSSEARSTMAVQTEDDRDYARQLEQLAEKSRSLEHFQMELDRLKANLQEEQSQAVVRINKLDQREQTLQQQASRHQAECEDKDREITRKMLEAEELLARQQLSSKLSEEQWRRREELMEEERQLLDERKEAISAKCGQLQADLREVEEKKQLLHQKEEELERKSIRLATEDELRSKHLKESPNHIPMQDILVLERENSMLKERVSGMETSMANLRRETERASDSAQRAEAGERELQRAVEEKKRECEHLERQLSGANAEKTGLISQVKQLVTENETMKRERESAKHREQQITAEAATVHRQDGDRLQKLEAQFKEVLKAENKKRVVAEDEAAELRSFISDMIGKEAEAKTLAEQLAAVVEEQRKKLKHSDAVMLRDRSELKKLQGKLQTSQHDLQEALSSMQGLRAEVEMLQEKRQADLRKELGNLSGESDSQNASSERLDSNSLKQMLGLVQAAESKAARLQTDIMHWESKVDELESVIKMKDRLLLEQSDMLSETKKQLGKMESAASQLEEQLVEKEEQRGASLQHSNVQLESVQTALEAEKRLTAHLERRVDSLEEELQRSQSKVEEKEKELRRSQSKHADLDKSMQKTRDLVKQLEMQQQFELQKARQAEEEKRKKLEEVVQIEKEGKEQLQVQLASLHKEMEAVQEAKRQALSQVAATEDEMRLLLGELEAHKEVGEKQRMRVSELLKEMAGL
jgi:chromosome segregation ATPase